MVLKRMLPKYVKFNNIFEENSSLYTDSGKQVVRLDCIIRLNIHM